MAREGQKLPGQGEPQPGNMVEAAGKPLAGRRKEASLGRAAGEDARGCYGSPPAGDRDGGDSGRQTTALTPARLRGRRHGGGARGAASPGRPAAPRPRGEEEEEEEDELTCHS